MGYTHYFQNESHEFTDNEWEAITEGAKEVVSRCQDRGVVIQREYDDSSQPVIDNERILFNGAGEDGHETFELARADHQFRFCKTARKPYDLAVVAILELVKLISGVEYGSDGIEEDRQEGIELAEEVVKHFDWTLTRKR